MISSFLHSLDPNPLFDAHSALEVKGSAAQIPIALVYDQPVVTLVTNHTKNFDRRIPSLRIHSNLVDIADSKEKDRECGQLSSCMIIWSMDISRRKILSIDLLVHEYFVAAPCGRYLSPSRFRAKEHASDLSTQYFSIAMGFLVVNMILSIIRNSGIEAKYFDLGLYWKEIPRWNDKSKLRKRRVRS